MHTSSFPHRAQMPQGPNSKHLLDKYPSSSIIASSPVCIHSVPFSSFTMTLRVCSSSFQYPFWRLYPATRSSPGWPMGTILPNGSTTFAETCGWIFPTVSTRARIGSSGVVWKETGLVSADRRIAMRILIGDSDNKECDTHSFHMHSLNL